MGNFANPATQLVDNFKFQVWDGAKFTDTTQGELFIGAQAFATFAGSGALGVGAGATGWLLDAASDETLTVLHIFPDGWNAMTAEVYWANASTGAGAVCWDVAVAAFTVGAVVAADATASVTATASTTANLLVKSATSGVLPVTTDGLTRIKLNRDADNAADTVANDAIFLGVRFTRVNL